MWICESMPGSKIIFQTYITQKKNNWVHAHAKAQKNNERRTSSHLIRFFTTKKKLPTKVAGEKKSRCITASK